MAVPAPFSRRAFADVLAKVLDYVCKGAAKLGVRTMAGVVDAKLHQDGYTPLLGIDDAAACQHSFELGEGAALDGSCVDAHHGCGREHVGKGDIGLLGRPVKERALGIEGLRTCFKNAQVALLEGLEHLQASFLVLRGEALHVMADVMRPFALSGKVLAGKQNYRAIGVFLSAPGAVEQLLEQFLILDHQ